MTVEAGREISIGHDQKERCCHRIYVDEVSELVHDRGTQIKSDENRKKHVKE